MFRLYITPNTKTMCHQYMTFQPLRYGQYLRSTNQTVLRNLKNLCDSSSVADLRSSVYQLVEVN